MSDQIATWIRAYQGSLGSNQSPFATFTAPPAVCVAEATPIFVASCCLGCLPVYQGIMDGFVVSWGWLLVGEMSTCWLAMQDLGRLGPKGTAQR